jgi:membrane protein YdbS with pleckstrin-like domain
MAQTKEYWFPTKKYGWGWGLPTVWQGWVVLIAFAVGLTTAAVVLPPSRHPGAFALVMVVASIFLVLVCYLKGEPPRWRWGKGGDA